MKIESNIVYDRFIVPVGLHYYGHTDDVKRRNQYKTTALQQYIDQYGWENITTTVIKDGLTRKEAELLEDKLIKEGWERGDCINKQGSGGERRDNPKDYRKKYYENHKEELKDYRKQYYENHKEELKDYHKQHYQDNKEKISQYSKQHYQDNKEYYQQYRNNHKEELKGYHKQQYSKPEHKIYYRVNIFNQRHPDKVVETPKEARQKYLETGYIPDYIKNNDLI